MDVTDSASIVRAFDAAEAALGPVSVLINNAGVVVEKAAVDQTEADWDKVLNANLKGAFIGRDRIRPARASPARARGSVINISSVLGIGVIGHVSTYSASKAALIQLTKSFALEWASKGIRVNALAPGYIDTEFNHDFWSTPPGERLIKGIPQRRLGHESDLDGAILLLASRASRYMTGSVLTVDCAPARPRAANHLRRRSCGNGNARTTVPVKPSDPAMWRMQIEMSCSAIRNRSHAAALT